MSPKVRLRHRMNVILQMVTALIVAILLGQLWLFTITLEAMEDGSASPAVAVAAAVFSVLGCVAIWGLIRLFLRTEAKEL